MTEHRFSTSIKEGQAKMSTGRGKEQKEIFRRSEKSQEFLLLKVALHQRNHGKDVTWLNQVPRK